MTFKEYIEETKRTCPLEANKENLDIKTLFREKLTNSALGMCGEVGEINDMIKKYRYQGHQLDKIKIKEELGDLMWYIAMLIDTCDFTFEEILRYNIAKLRKRYSDGFDKERSINRNE